MTLKNRIQITYHETKQWILYIVRRMWLVGFVRKWNKLWIRKNEFDKTLDMDSEMMMYMKKTEREKYMVDLVRRRNIAHERGMD
jgi:hypothetical protein